MKITFDGLGRKKWDDNRSQPARQTETTLEISDNNFDDDIEKENEHKIVINN